MLNISFAGKHGLAYQDTTREIDIEGAIRSGKTTLCLTKELTQLLEHPGMFTLLARWTDDSVYGLLVPLWVTLCQQAGAHLDWNSHEQYYALPNGSRAFVRGLRAQDILQRYSKFRGLTLSRVYVDQAEELPQDIYLELAGRLSQPGFDHQITISPQSVAIDHWIAREFPADHSKPERAYYPLSIHDNAHNLPSSVIPALTRLYPPEHPQHRTLILGLRGMNVIGETVYKGAFVRTLHEGVAEYDQRLPLEMALDFGKHHPCVVFRQISPLGQVRFLGGILGQDLYLDDFLEVALRYRSEWFPNPSQIRECCDPAGASDTSHGTEGAVKILRGKHVHPVYVGDSNSPAMRLAAIERMASQMRRRTADNSESLIVSSSDRWLRVSSQSTLVDRFLADGYEAGYVWSDHSISVGNKQVRTPKKDGWYEHGQNCAEYLELNFGNVAKPKVIPPSDRLAFPASPGGWMVQ